MEAKTRPKLAPFIRLTIYSYLRLKDLLKVEMTSKTELKLVQASHIVRGNRSFEINMENDFIEVNEKVGKVIILGGWGQEMRKIISYSESLTIIGLM